MPFTRRHLPHWIPEETVVFVTWRLAGSMAACSVERSFLAQDERLDAARSGPLWLQDSRVASVMANAILYGETARRFYELHAWVVMPNHVHAIFQPHSEMPAIMRWLKGRTARVANRILGRAGAPFWKEESFDHWVRSAEELSGLVEYVEDNPVKAGLVSSKALWRWSSASSIQLS
jgi:REP element-mobilizing transposase RayT